MTNYDDEIDMITKNPLSFSPIVIIVDDESGKTTLIQRLRTLKKSEVFDAEEVCKSMVASIIAYDDLWKERFALCDVIILDDRGYLSGKTATQGELLTYFLTCGKAIILITKSEIKGKEFLSEFSSFFANGRTIRY